MSETLLFMSVSLTVDKIRFRVLTCLKRVQRSHEPRAVAMYEGLSLRFCGELLRLATHGYDKEPPAATVDWITRGGVTPVKS